MPGTLLPATMRALQGQAELPAGPSVAGVEGFQGLWLVGTNYADGTEVTGSDGHVYISKLNDNIGHNPVGDAGVHWQAAAA